MWPDPTRSPARITRRAPGGAPECKKPLRVHSSVTALLSSRTEYTLKGSTLRSQRASTITHTPQPYLTRLLGYALTARFLRYDCRMKYTNPLQQGRVIAWSDSLFETLPYPDPVAQPMIPVGEATELEWAHPGMFDTTTPAELDSE